jgi:RNA-binding protein FUS
MILGQSMGSGGGGGGGAGGNDMVTQEDTIFVSGMNPDTTEEEMAVHFGAIGVIKVSGRVEH